MKFVSLATVVLTAGLLAACSTPHVIGTKDGTLIPTANTPKLDEKTGMYSFEDEEGREQQIRKEDVKQIIER